MSKLKGGTLSMRWSKRERDLLISYPSKPDGHLLHCRLNSPRFDGDHQPMLPSFIEELTARGYDITTLRFSVRRKAEPKLALRAADNDPDQMLNDGDPADDCGG